MADGKSIYDPHIVGAIIAGVLNSKDLNIWAFNDGFQRVKTPEDPPTSTIPQMTYREARLLRKDGLSPSTRFFIEGIGKSAVKTQVKNAAILPNINPQTTITQERDWTETPIVAVRGHNVVYITVNGQESSSDTINALIKTLGLLEEKKVPFLYSNTVPVSFYQSVKTGEYEPLARSSFWVVEDKYSAEIVEITRALEQDGQLVKTDPYEFCEIVGEGLADAKFYSHHFFPKLLEIIKKDAIGFDKFSQSIVQTVTFNKESNLENLVSDIYDATETMKKNY